MHSLLKCIGYLDFTYILFNISLWHVQNIETMAVEKVPTPIRTLDSAEKKLILGLYTNMY